MVSSNPLFRGPRAPRRDPRKANGLFATTTTAAGLLVAAVVVASYCPLVASATSVISAAIDDEFSLPIANDRIPLSVMASYHDTRRGPSTATTDGEAMPRSRKRTFSALSLTAFTPDEQAHMANSWCLPDDPIVAYATDAAKPSDNGTIRSSYLVNTSRAETIVARIVTPAPVLYSMDTTSAAIASRRFRQSSASSTLQQARISILAYVEERCDGVSATFFGTSAVMLHGTLGSLQRCVRAAGLGVGGGIVTRLCHWHDDVIIHPDVQRGLAREEELAAAAAGSYGATGSAGDASMSHIIAVVSPRAGAHGSSTTTTCPHYSPSQLAAYYNGVLGVEGRTRGYRFVMHSLSDESEDDSVRHFVCGGDEAAVAEGTCNLTALVAFIQMHVSDHEGGVLSIEARHLIRVHNKFSRGLLQSGVQYEEPFGRGLGLDGEGYIVAVADTGIDYDHCFFRDPQRAVPLNKQDMSHRKIIRYQVAAGNEGDYLPGHGTHVAGSIAGAPFDPSNEYADFHGVLPKAKLSVWDQSTGRGEGLRGVSNYNDFFGISYRDGARVHSNSWGTAGSYYSNDASAVDGYTNRNNFMLPIFAAGNDADAKCGKMENDLYCDRRTVINPCVAKNALCVGASMGSYDSWKYAKLGNYVMRVPGLSDTTKYTVLKGNFGPTDVSALASVDMVLAQPLSGCGGLTNKAGTLKGKMVVFVRGTCTFIEKIIAAQKSGAIGALIVNNVNGDAIIMGCDDFGDCGVTIANFMINMPDGNALVDYLKTSNADPKAMVAATEARDPHKGEDNLSEFSSHGPTSDNRYKPEVVAVGELVVSAFSDANLNSMNCDIWATQGTSMATPLTSGLATLLLQYFEKGIHIDGSLNNKGRGMTNITSSFIKAAIIHAATPLTGVFDRNSRGDWRQLGRAPTSEQGFGKPRLNHSFPTSSSSNIKVFVDDTATVSQGGFNEYCIDYNGKADSFTATLVWIDPANKAGASYTLINNLDLIVVTPDGSRSFHGNMDPRTDAQTDVRAAGATYGFDVLNNAEKVRLPNAPAGTYRVRVRGTNIPSGTQRYSLLASGTEAKECPLFCTTATYCVHGTCGSKTDGLCTCLHGWHGPRCDVPMFTAPRAAAANATIILEPMQWSYFRLPAKQGGGAMVLTSLTRDGEVDYSLCDTAANSATLVDKSSGGSSCFSKDTACQTCGTNGPPATHAPLTIPYNSVQQERTLSVTAQCCYTAIVSVASAGGGADDTVPEIIGLDAATHTSVGTQAAKGSAEEEAAHTYTIALRVADTAKVIDGAKHMIVLRSSEWSNGEGDGLYHECAIDAARSYKEVVTCTTRTLPCHDDGTAPSSSSAAAASYFAIALVAKDASRDVVSAPHPTVAHVTCRHFRDQQAPSSSPTSVTPAGGNGADAHGDAGYHTMPPNASIPAGTNGIPPVPTVTGMRGPSGSTTRRLTVPYTEAIGRAYTIVGGGFRAASQQGLLSIKMTVQRVGAADAMSITSPLTYSKGRFVEVRPPPTTDDDSVQFVLPSVAEDVINLCHTASSSAAAAGGATSDGSNSNTADDCGVVRVLMNVVMTLPNTTTHDGDASDEAHEHVAFIADLTIFVVMPPRIVALTMLRRRMDDPLDETKFYSTFTIPSAEVARYNDANYYDKISIYKGEKWFYLKGRFFTDPRSSATFGGLLRDSTLVPTASSASSSNGGTTATGTATAPLLRFRIPAMGSTVPEQLKYCAVLNVLSDEAIECMVSLAATSQGASAAPTRIGIEASFGGGSGGAAAMAPQPRVTLQLGPSGMVTNMLDRIGTISSLPKMSSYLTVTMAGVALPVGNEGLLVATATYVGVSASSPTTATTAIPLKVVRLTADLLVLQMEAPTARAGIYAVTVSLTRNIPLGGYAASCPLRFEYLGQGAAAYLTGLSYTPQPTMGVGMPAASSFTNVSTLALNTVSTHAKLITIRLTGVNTHLLLAEAAVVRLTNTVETVVTYQQCHLAASRGSAATDLSSSSPTASTKEIACHVSPFARGTQVVELLLGQHKVPAYSAGLTLTLRVPTDPALPPYATAFAFDTALLVNTPMPVTLLDEELVDSWADDVANVGVYVSATPCYDPTIIGTSTVVYADAAEKGVGKDTIIGFEITATRDIATAAHVCLANGAARAGDASSNTILFYTRVFLDIIVVSISDVTVVPSLTAVNSGGGAFDVTVTLATSLIAEYVDHTYIYADLIAGNQSCGKDASAWNAHAEAYWYKVASSADGQPYLKATIQGVRLNDAKASALTAIGASPRLCLALSTNDNEVALDARRFVYAQTTFDCLHANSGRVCSGVGACGPAGQCVCDPWYGGPQCAYMCEVDGGNGETCSGYACGGAQSLAAAPKAFRGGCDCSGSAMVDEYGTSIIRRGPSCNVPAQQVRVGGAADGSSTVATATIDTVRTYYPASHYTVATAASERSVGTIRPMPIVMELSGEGLSAVMKMGSASEVGSAAYRHYLDVVVVAPADARSVSVRLHRNDSRLLQPIGAAFVGSADAVGPYTDGGARTYTTFAIPLSPIDGSSSGNDNKGVHVGYYLVVEVATDASTFSGEWSHASVGLNVRSARAAGLSSATTNPGGDGFSSLDTLVAKGIIANNKPRHLTMRRLDTSGFTSTFSLLGFAMSFMLGVSVSFLAMARRKILTLRGPRMLWRTVVAVWRGDEGAFDGREDDHEMGEMD